MARPTSLLERSEQLRVVARSAAEKEGDVDERERVVRALDDLETETTLLKGILETWAAAETAEIVKPPSLGRWVQSVQALTEHVAGIGRPKAERIRGTLTTLRRDRSRLEDELKEFWKQWAMSQVDGVPQEKLALLPADERTTARGRLQQLTNEARGNPTPAMIRSFRLAIASLTKQLDEVSADAVLHSALRKLDGSPPPSLHDFADDELSALRAHPEIAGQVLMRRR